MILSQQQIFSDQQAIVATALSTNVIDTGVRGTVHGSSVPFDGDIGPGNDIPLLVQVTEDFDNLTTLEVAIETGSAVTLGTVLLSQTIALVDLLAGKQLNFDEIPNGAVERYLGLRYTVVGTGPSAGKVTAGISMGNQTNVTGV